MGSYPIRNASTVTATWTDARVERCRELWFSGLSATECAQRLGGTTRSAVIGLVNRRVWKRVADIDEGKRAQALAQKVIAVRLPPPPRPKPIPAVITRGVITTQLTITSCRFVIHDKPWEQRHCGEHTDAGPYCDRHRRMCWTGIGVKVAIPKSERARRGG